MDIVLTNEPEDPGLKSLHVRLSDFFIICISGVSNLLEFKSG